MTSDSYGIASAAVALPGWRWLAGMRWHVRRAPPLDDIAGYLVHPLPPGSHPYPGALPDLSDPATAGCLLALLGPAASRVSLADGTDFACLSDHPVSAGPPPPMTLGAACVAVALRCGRWPGGGDL